MGSRFRRRPQSERGAVALLMAALMIVLLSAAALGVDLASQINRKHLLINQLDAASTAAASQFSDGSLADAVAAAQLFFAENGQGELDLHDIDFWCVVARKLNGDNTPFNPAMVASYQIPTATQTGGTCNPDAATPSTLWRQSDYQNRIRAWDNRRFSMTCNNKLCAVPCALNAGPGNGWDPGLSVANGKPITCNTIRVGAEQDVPFSFAPAIGIDKGSTGSQVSVACAGACGLVAPNPMDVAIVADRTLSMTDSLGCTLGGTRPPGCRDYREDLVAGIQSLLKVMTPEQQYVALGALGPSRYTRADSESRQCNSSSEGLVYPSDLASTSSRGSWMPISFKNDYLGAPDSNGVRALNSNSKLVQAVDCLDAISSEGEDRLADTRTALASPLKAAARYLLGKSGDENNIASLGGASRSGTVKKVIIFETDGEPYENATTSAAGALTLDNRTDIFSNYNDFTTTTSTNNTASNGPTLNGRPSGVNAPNACSGNRCTYRHFIRTTSTTTNARTYVGGQEACENFEQIAELAKQQGILIITIGYSLDSARCGDSNNGGSLPGNTDTTANGQSWISNITPSSCRASGSGTQASPYVPRSNCTQTITWTQLATRSITTHANRIDNPLVTDVLAGASGGDEVPIGASDGCVTTDQIAAENGDGDLFFCAARGDDLAPLFVTALSTVGGGVKLIKLP